jgi:signal transduction histidine kinase
MVESPMIIQILVNLMKNGIEAMDESVNPDRRMTIRTGVVTRSGKDYNFCEIVDNGPGIPDQTLKRLFEFGFTTKSQTKGGQGVGLHFCRKTLESQGGYVDAGNAAGGGACFTFGLPARSRGAK